MTVNLTPAAVVVDLGPGILSPGITGEAVGPSRSHCGGLLARYREWRRQLDDAARLREIEPRLARDIGIVPGRDRCPDGYTVDPRPLWGIGLTPRPAAALPFRDRR